MDRDIATFISKLRGINHVVRWNMHPTIRKENVAEHSFWVAIFAMILAPEELRLKTMAAALLHDVEEAVTGDLPALIKAKTPGWASVVARAEREMILPAADQELLLEMLELREMAEQSVAVKLADLFAALMYARMEIEMGNTHFARIECELIGSIVGKAKATPALDVSRRAVLLLHSLGFDHEAGLARPVDMSHL